MKIIARNITGIENERKSLVNEIKKKLEYEGESTDVIKNIILMITKYSCYIDKFFTTNDGVYFEMRSDYRYKAKFILDVNSKDDVDVEVLETKVYKVFAIDKLINILKNNKEYKLCINNEGDYVIPLKDDKFYVLHEYGLIIEMFICNEKNIIEKIIL